MRLSLRSLLLLASFALASCESSTSDFVAATGETRSVRDTRVFFADRDHCVFTKPKGQAAFFAAALIPAVVSTAIGTLQTAIQNASAADKASISGYVNIKSSGQLPACVEVVSARFRTEPEPLPPQDADTIPAWFQNYPSSPGTTGWGLFHDLLKTQGVWIGHTDDDAPDFLFEAAIVSYTPPAKPAPAASARGATTKKHSSTAASKRAPGAPASGGANAKASANASASASKPAEPQLYFKLVPTFASFRRSPEDHRSIFRPSPVTDLTATLTFAAPGAEQPPSAAVPIGRMQAGQSILLNVERLGTQAPFNPEPSYEKESAWTVISVPEKDQPLTITATVAENRTASATGTFVASVIGASKSDLTTGIDNQLLPDQRRAAAASAAQKSAQAEANYAAALKQALTDLKTCAAYTTAPPTTAFATAQENISVLTVQADERSANASAIAAAHALPFRSLSGTPSDCVADMRDIGT